MIPKPQTVDGFNKKEWIREYKLMRKDQLIEERDRLRPLMCSKREFAEPIREFEAAEKRDGLSLAKDEDQQALFIER